MLAYTAVLLLALLSYCEAGIVGTWVVNGNGYTGNLVIGGVDSSGNLLSSSYLGNSIQGFWSAYENKITFIRLIGSAPSTWQTYIGYHSNQGTGDENLFGYFDAYTGTGATYLFNRAGWSGFPEPAGYLSFTPTPITPTVFTSGTWNCNSNGYTGYFYAYFNSDGSITGSFRGTTISDGFWNIQSRSVDFIIVTNPAVPTSQQIYHGYLEEYELFSTEQVLNGYFTALAGTGAVADVTEYGWQAYITLPSTSTGTAPPTQ